MVYKREAIKFWNWFKENNDKIKILIDDNDINSVNEFLKDAIINVYGRSINESIYTFLTCIRP